MLWACSLCIDSLHIALEVLVSYLVLRLRHLNYFLVGWFVSPTLSRFFMYALLIHHYFGVRLTCTEFKTWDCFVDTVLFLMWFQCHGSCVWACLLQLIRIDAKKHFLHHRLESRNLTLVIAFSLYNGDNAFTLSSSLFASTCFYFWLLPIYNSIMLHPVGSQGWEYVY